MDQWSIIAIDEEGKILKSKEEFRDERKRQIFYKRIPAPRYHPRTGQKIKNPSFRE